MSIIYILIIKSINDFNFKDVYYSRKCKKSFIEAVNCDETKKFLKF